MSIRDNNKECLPCKLLVLWTSGVSWRGEGEEGQV